jgi:hypothetical protein
MIRMVQIYKQNFALQNLFSNFLNKMIDYQIEINNIAKRIKEIRRSKGLTVQEVAYRCDIERSNLSRIEAGRTNLTLKTICLICNALNVRISDIVR